MRTGSQDKIKLKSSNQALKNLKIKELSKRFGFKKRKEKKITAQLLIESFFESCSGCHFSLQQWAISIAGKINKNVSKQAVFDRINQAFVDMIQHLVQKALSGKVNGKNKILSRFSNLLIQDSSCIALPQELVKTFPGNYSRGKIKAVAKVQLIFNMIKGNFQSIQLTPYNRNDQSASRDILDHLKKGDLVIRDMGYFVIDVFQNIMDKGADFISRLVTNIVITDCKSGKPINLYHLLKKKTFVKRKVLIGAKQKLEVTLLAIKVDQKTQQYRIAKALKDRDHRKKITVEKLAMKGWDIFICSVSDLTGQEIRDLYRLRWQIELIFKTWKSHLHIESNIHPQIKRPQMVQTIIFLSLLLAILIVMPVYSKVVNCKKLIGKISFIKLSKILINTLSKHIINLEMLLYYASYDTRKRITLSQKVYKLT